MRSRNSDNKYIFSGALNNTLGIWSFKEKSLEAVLPGHGKNLKQILITSDYKYVVSSTSNKEIRIWNLKDRTQIGQFCDSTSASEWILKYREIESLFH